MPASCSDFVSAILEAMVEAEVIREDDIPDENPERQAALALDALRRLVEIKDLGSALASHVQSSSAPSEAALDAAASLVDSVERILPRWLSSDEYEHCFVGSKATRTRWAVDLSTGKMVYAQAFGETRWHDLHRDEVADLREDVMDTNEIRLNPEDFGAVMRDLPPTWAFAESAEPAQA